MKLILDLLPQGAQELILDLLPQGAQELIRPWVLSALPSESRAP